MRFLSYFLKMVAGFLRNYRLELMKITRLKKRSGVQLTEAPFHFKSKTEQQMVAIALEDADSVIVTTLYTIF